MRDYATSETTSRDGAVTRDHSSQLDDREVGVQSSQSVDVVMIEWIISCDSALVFQFSDEFTMQKIFLFTEWNDIAVSVIITETNCCRYIKVLSFEQNSG